ncbi:MAG: HEPN domain-containing protein [Burkholderiales bacterium]
MSAWTQKDTDARVSVGPALRVVDDLLSFMSAGQGKPSKKERAIFAAAVVFTYGVWESYIEELAVEVATRLSAEIKPSRVPENVQTFLQEATAWELGVHPGWQSLWVKRVKATAKGEGESYGLNTARVKQVSALLKTAGLGDVFKNLPANIVPSHLAGQPRTVASAVDELVKLRGEIVHSGSVPNSLKKHDAREWRQFVEALSTEIDKACRIECRNLLT